MASSLGIEHLYIKHSLPTLTPPHLSMFRCQLPRLFIRKVSPCAWSGPCSWHARYSTYITVLWLHIHWPTFLVDKVLGHLLYLCWEQRLAHSRCSINDYWMSLGLAQTNSYAHPLPGYLLSSKCSWQGTDDPSQSRTTGLHGVLGWNCFLGEAGDKEVELPSQPEPTGCCFH